MPQYAEFTKRPDPEPRFADDVAPLDISHRLRTAVAAVIPIITQNEVCRPAYGGGWVFHGANSLSRR